MNSSKGFLGGTADLSPTAPTKQAQQDSSHIAGAIANQGTQAARSLGSLGRALSNMGGEGMQIAFELQQAKNAKVEREKRNEWDIAFAQHEADNMGIRDPEEKMAKFEAFASDMSVKAFEGDYMPPALKRNLEARWGGLITQKRSRALTQVGQLMVDQTRAAFGVAMDNAKEHGTIENWNEIGRDMREKGMMTAPELESYQMKGEKIFKAKEDEALRKWHIGEITRDPKAHLETLSAKNGNGDFIGYENLELEDRRHMIKGAKREIVMKRNEEVDYVKNLIIGGGITNPSQLKEMRESGDLKNLDESDYAALKKHLTREKPASDGEVVDAMQQIDSLREKKGSISDVEYAKQYRKLENHVMGITQKGDSGWLKQRLNYHNPNYDKRASGNPLLKEGKAEAMEEATKHLGILFKNGDFGAVDNGEDGDDRKLNADSAKSYRDIQRDVEQWVEKQDKPPSIEEVHEYMGEAINRKTGKSAFKNFNKSVKDNPTQKRWKGGTINDSIALLGSGLLPVMEENENSINADQEAALLPYINE